jgi:hypothetical protein
MRILLWLLGGIAAFLVLGAITAPPAVKLSPAVEQGISEFTKENCRYSQDSSRLSKCISQSRDYYLTTIGQVARMKDGK